jgi:hypothetical protein
MLLNEVDAEDRLFAEVVDDVEGIIHTFFTKINWQ